MTTARTTPTGDMLENGYQSLLAPAADADVDLWEKICQPPGIEGGDKINITTQHNSAVKTFAAQALYELSDGNLTVGYDPAVLSQTIALCNANGELTQHFPDGSTWDFFGFYKNFVPTGLQNGNHPEATCVLVCTNVNASGAETAPVYTAPSP